MKRSCMFIRLLVPLFVLIAQAPAAVLVPTAATWRWRPGTNEASVPVNLWREAGFADTQFTTAPAPFWYGDVLPGGTQINGMQNVYLCVFLRKTFVVTNLAEIGGLRLGALVDDGFVAWINGTEVQRVNMPGAAGTAVRAGAASGRNIPTVRFESLKYSFATRTTSSGVTRLISS